MAFRDTIRSLSPPLYRLRIFVFMCAGIVLVVSTYYFLFVRNQTGYFNNRNLRKLSLISSQIGSKITSAASVMEKTCERFIRLSEEDPDRFSIESADLATKQKNIHQLRDVFNELKDDSLQIIPFDIQVEKWSDKPTPGIVTLTDIRHEGGSAWLYIDYVANGLKAGTLIRVKAKTELNGLIQPFLTARVGSQPDQFQNILIAEAEPKTARVIVQHDMTEVRLASVDKLNGVVDGKKFDLREIAQTSNMADIGLAGANYRLFSHPLKVSLPATSTDPPNPNPPSTNWIVAGLIQSDYFQSEAWSLSIPYTMLIIFGFVVAVIVFSWPFLKLVLVGPKDRFRTHDVYLLVFATMIVLAVVTAFGLYAFVYLSVEAEMDGHVKRLAGDLKRNFEEELTNALKQLDKFSNNQALLDHLMAAEKQREIEKLDGKQGTSPGGAGALASEEEGRSRAREQLEIQATCPPNIYDVAETNKIKILPCILGEEATYPYFEMVAWIDHAGMQQAKWTVKDYTTQKVSVADRAYFQNIQKKHFYELGEHKFWLEPIVSRTTGRNQVEISQQVKDTDWTIAFDTRLLSLMDPVLPDGFGYVIVNKDGGVLFHSDEVHHLGENLLKECDDNRNLRSAIIGRADKPLDVRYSGEDHSFFVTTLEGFPDWSFVVFRSKQPLRSAFLELMTALTALFLFHMIVLMGAFTVFYFIYTRNRRRAWLWPEKKKIDSYKQLSYLMLSLSFISLLFTLFLHGQWLVIVSAGLAWLGGLVFFLSLRYGPWTRLTQLGNWVSQVLSTKQSTTLEAGAEPGNTTNQAVNSSEAESKPATFEPDEPLLRRFDGIYALNLMFLVLLIAILPMGALFKYLYENQATLFIKHAQFSMATALERRDERIRSQYAHVSPSIELNRADKSHQRETNILTRRLNETWDVYDSFFYGTFHEKHEETQRSNQSQPSDQDLLSRVSAWLPVSNRSAIERRGLLANSAVMGVCHWPSITSDALVMNLKDNAGKPAWPWRRLSTSVPILRISVLPAIGVLCLSVPLFFLIHFLIRKVFLLDVHKPSSYSLKKFLCDAFERNCFVVAKAPFFRKTDFASSLYLKNFSELASSIRWKGEFDDQCAEGTVIAFDQFEYQMDDARTNRKRLTMLNKLLKEKRNLVLFSAVEPSDYKFGKGDANGLEDGAGEWADVIISNFVTEYAEDTDDRYSRDDDKSSFKHKVDEHRDRIKRGGLKGRKREDVEELINTVYTECAPRVPLQDVGLRILEAKDFLELTKDHLLGRIVSQARSYYNYLWNSCSGPQKQTLCHLAMDGRLSHRDPDIQSLLRRNLIVRDEGLHLFNESFRKFVKSTERRKDIAEDDQKASDQSLWQTLKMPILVTMIFVGGFLFWTQQDIFSSSLAVVTGVTGLITAVFKLMSVFHGDERAK